MIAAKYLIMVPLQYSLNVLIKKQNSCSLVHADDAFPTSFLT
jgi:hypothetical protein